MAEIKINVKQMKEDFGKLDPVEFKYKELLSLTAEGGMYQGKSKEAWYIKFSWYEESQQFEELTKSEFHHLQANLDMAYAEDELTDDLFEIYNLVAAKIVRKYINIDGVERLFSEKYANFEWEMHLGMDHKKHSMKFYRDHFIHQIKDAYTMIKLLEKGGFYEKVKNVLIDAGSSNVSRYVKKMLDQQAYLPRKRVFLRISPEMMRKHYIYNIIYMAGCMAGMFHDIGYPTASNMQEHRRMIDYIVENHFFEKGNYDFNSIMALLQNSLLFRVVSPAEIRSRIEGDDIDHGTVSALLFLLHFYENGAIYRLEPYKLCAVELAGLAIYNHTNKYAYIGQENAGYERCLFSANPISYLLRVCDDLQEWGRIYFEVSQQSNLIICDKCRMPIRRVKKRETVSYQCGCEGKELFVPMFKYYGFPYRRIYNVSVCDDMEVLWEENTADYEFHLEYNLGKLLHIAYINPSYARYRIKELAQMKHLFPSQYDIGMVFVDYFVTSNIILIKSKIIGEYIKKAYVSYQEKIDDCIEKWIKEEIDMHDPQNVSGRQSGKGIQASKVRMLINEIFKNKGFQGFLFPWEMESDLEEYIKFAFELYIFIHIMMCLGRKANTEYPAIRGEVQKKISALFKNQNNKKTSLKFCSEDVRLLIGDCRVQIGNMYGNLSCYEYYPDNYFKTFLPEKDKDEIYYSALGRFADIDKYMGFSEQEQNKLDAFTDLYWFREMLEKIETV